MGLFNKKQQAELTLLVTVDINGNDIVFTGDFLVGMMNTYNSLRNFFVLLDTTSRASHQIIRNEQELRSVKKMNLKRNKGAQTLGDVKSGLLLFKSEELFPLIQELHGSQLIRTGLDNVNTERYIRHMGDQAYHDAKLITLSRGYGHSLNSDPNIRKLRTEQAYRQILKQANKGEQDYDYTKGI